jgi:uncharacterized protein YndB with AHSA1/START domain
MSTYDWSKFSTRINIRANLNDIYIAWTTRAGLERWFLRMAEFTTTAKNVRGSYEGIAAGDAYRWLWFGYDDTVVETGRVLEVNGKDLLRFTFAGSCVVTVAIKIEAGETIVELQQENIPLDEDARVNYHLGCLSGWTFYLANLKSVLEGGIDLRNKNKDLRKVVNA